MFPPVQWFLISIRAVLGENAQNNRLEPPPLVLPPIYEILNTALMCFNVEIQIIIASSRIFLTHRREEDSSGDHKT